MQNTLTVRKIRNYANITHAAYAYIEGHNDKFLSDGIPHNCLKQ